MTKIETILQRIEKILQSIMADQRSQRFCAFRDTDLHKAHDGSTSRSCPPLPKRAAKKTPRRKKQTHRLST
jgi:hypothetical protein